MNKYSDLTIKEKVELLLQLRNEDPELDQFVKKLDNLYQTSDKILCKLFLLPEIQGSRTQTLWD